MIGLPPGARIWLAAGVTDMRKGLRWACRIGSGDAIRESVLRTDVRVSRAAWRSGEAAVVER